MTLLPVLTSAGNYHMNGQALHQQPFVMTAPVPQGVIPTLPTGSCFLLLFDNPSVACMHLLQDGIRGRLRFTLADGRLVHGYVQCSSASLANQVYAVRCTLLSPIFL